MKLYPAKAHFAETLKKIRRYSIPQLIVLEEAKESTFIIIHRHGKSAVLPTKRY